MALLVLMLPWLFVFSGNTPYSRAIRKRLAADDAVVPEIRAFEIANNIFVSYSRRRRIAEQQIRDTSTFLRPCPSASKHRACVGKCRSGISRTPPEPCGLRQRLLAFSPPS